MTQQDATITKINAGAANDLLATINKQSALCAQMAAALEDGK